jgi:phosphatidylserine decarboxylase
VVIALVAGMLAALALALPLAWKWELGMRRSAAAIAVLGLIACAIVAPAASAVDAAAWLAGVLVAALTLALAAATVLWRFYRDPERAAPTDDDDIVVSPADGLVIYVRRSEGGELPVATKQGRAYALDELVRTPLRDEDAVVVGIALSFLDVHVNRSPIAGAVASERRFPGRFASLKDPAAVFTNERATFLIERDSLQVAVVLIASRLVRRIVSYVRAGEELAMGQRIGAIRFGSQVDLVLPDRDDVRVLVEPGERVWAGQTILAKAPAAAPGQAALSEAVG